MPEDMFSALQLRDWYAVAALALTFAVQVLRKAPWLSDRIWMRIPDGWRWAVPVVSGAALGFVGAYYEGATLGAALLAALSGAGAIGGGSMGLAAGLRESPIPWDGRAGGKPKPKKRLTDDDDTPPMGTAGGAGVGLMALVLVGCGVIGPADAADKACAEEALRATVRCNEVAFKLCGAYTDNPDECPRAAEVDAACERFVDEELQSC